MKVLQQRLRAAVLTDEGKAAAKELAKQIDRDLMARYTHFQPHSKMQCGVMGGLSGELLYLFYSSVYQENEQMYDLAFDCLEQIITYIDPQHDISFCGGFSGLLWSLYHLDNEGIITGAAEMIGHDVIDAIYARHIAEIKTGNYDFMFGGLGIAMPLIECRHKMAKHEQYLADIVDELDKSAARINDMAYWECMLKPDENLRGVSFGMSHGLPGVIAILSKIAVGGIATEKSTKLIDSVVRYMLSKKRQDISYSLYPSRFIDKDISDIFPGNGRTAWCYGDINIAFGLLYAWKATGNHSYLQEARNILQYLTERNTATAHYTADGSFCHGAFGNAHLYNRLYNYLGDESLREASGFWFAKGMEKVSCENGQVKVYTLMNGEESWAANGNLIMGTAGIGLAIISALSGEPGRWDDAFLINI